MKLLRTIRLDPSDTFVFERAAEPGEWAVSGAFVFWDADPATLSGKARAAFRGGFLGVESLGHDAPLQLGGRRSVHRTPGPRGAPLHFRDAPSDSGFAHPWLAAPSRSAAAPTR